VHEELWAGIALTGLRERRSWSASRDRADVFDAKGLGELVLAAAGAPGSSIARWAAGTRPRYLEEGRAAGLAVDGRAVGWFGELALGVREAFDLPAPVFVAELSLTALGALPQAVPRYQPLPRFPAVQRDLAIVVPSSVLAGDVEARLRAMQGAMQVPLLTRILLFDVYQGDQVGQGRRSLAFSLTYQAPDRTLTDREVNDLHATIVAEIRARFGAEIRGA
jgi:phenylalanyl-tRNA synthetase beta chain